MIAKVQAVCGALWAGAGGYLSVFDFRTFDGGVLFAWCIGVPSILLGALVVALSVRAPLAHPPEDIGQGERS